MEFTNSYCKAIHTGKADPVHKIYHDNEYGFPIYNDDALFGRLILEINQAGLSWTTILKKKNNFYTAYDAFSIDKIANYTESDKQRLLSNPGIVRNKLKVHAAIYNAQAIQKLQTSHGSFKKWLDHHHPMQKDKWVKLFKNTFKFTGGEITGEFLMSTGYLHGAHDPNCPVYEKIMETKPPWMM